MLHILSDIIPKTLRTLLSFCIVMIIFAIWIILKNSDKKEHYSHITGKIIYLEKRLGELPIRDFGRYRYLKVENYQYPFEIYTDEQGRVVDSLKNGDLVTIYFYETESTQEDHLNRYTQFLQKNNKLYFSRTTLYQQLGYIIILMMLVFAYFCYHRYKAGKLPY